MVSGIGEAALSSSIPFTAMPAQRAKRRSNSAMLLALEARCGEPSSVSRRSITRPRSVPARESRTSRFSVASPASTV